MILEVQSLVNHCDAFTPHVGNRVTLFCLSIYSFQGLKLKQNKKEKTKNMRPAPGLRFHVRKSEREIRIGTDSALYFL